MSDLTAADMDMLYQAYVDSGGGDLDAGKMDMLYDTYVQSRQPRAIGILSDIGEGVKQFGSGAIKGISGTAGLLADVSGVTDLVNTAKYVTGISEEMPKQALGGYDLIGGKWTAPQLQATRLADELTDPITAAEPEGPSRYLRTAGEFVGPGGIISKLGKKGLGAIGRAAAVDLAASQGAQAAEDATGNQTIAPLLGAMAAGSVPGLLVGKPARGLAKAAQAEADSLELRAFGVNKSDINRVNKNNFDDLVDAGGEIVSPLNTAITSFRSMAGKSVKDHDPTSLIIEIQKQEESLAQALGQKLGQAAQQQKTTVTPSFAKTQAYVKTLSGLSDKRGAEIAQEAMRDVLRKIDRNDITSIHRAKIAVGKEINSAAWGADRTALQSNIYKRIYSDLREAVEQGYEQITGRAGTEIKALNNEIGMRMGLHKSFTELLNQTQSQDVVTRMMQLWRSSGGWAVPAAGAAAYSGLGIPAAALTFAGGKFLQSPQGKLMLADSLRSKAVQGTLRGISDPSASVRGRAARSGALALTQPTDVDPGESELRSTEAQAGSTQQDQPTARPGLLPKYRLGQSASQSKGEQSSLNNYTSDSAADSKKIKATDNKAKAQDISDMKMTPENKDSVLDAVRQVESGGGKYLKSPAGALGPYQFMPATAKELGVNPRDKDETDDRAGADKMLSRLQRKFGSLELALAAYNWGEGNIAKAIKRAGSEDWELVKEHVPLETQRYVPKVLGLLV